MEWKIWVPIIGIALSGLITVYLKRKEQSDVRAAIKIDAEVLNLLPNTSTVREVLIKHIDDRYTQLIHEEGNAQRDPAGVSAGVFLILVAAAMCFPAVRYGDWYWWIPAIVGFPLGLLGIWGFIDSLRQKTRGERN
jgi:hypothetical protein